MIKAIRNMASLLLLAHLFMFTTTINAADQQSYRIGPGDTLSIIVFGEEDMSLKEIRVSAHSTISFPLLGEVVVSEFTIRQLEKKIITLLKDGYLKKPVVTVSVLEYRLFFVNGEVDKPGGYNFVNGLTIQKAISLAGGFGERASKEKITLERESLPGVLNKVDLNDSVRPGDIITVGESFF